MDKRLPAAASVDVLPIFFLQQINEHEEHQQKQRHENAHRLAFLLDGLTGIVEKIRDVPDELIILFWLQGAWGHCIDSHQYHPSAAAIVRLVLEYRLLQSMQPRQHIWHCSTRQKEIVHAPRAGLVDVEALHIRIEV